MDTILAAIDGPFKATSPDAYHTRRVAAFIAGSFNGRALPFDLFELRAVDVGISDDMLCCLNVPRWARGPVRGGAHGEMRVREIVRRLRQTS